MGSGLRTVQIDSEAASVCLYLRDLCSALAPKNAAIHFLSTHLVKDKSYQNWNFCFVTSHNKSPCDGNGGAVKRRVACASLQATEQGHMWSPFQLYTWANEHISGSNAITFVSQDYVTAHNFQDWILI